MLHEKKVDKCNINNHLSFFFFLFCINKALIFLVVKLYRIWEVGLASTVFLFFVFLVNTRMVNDMISTQFLSFFC